MNWINWQGFLVGLTAFFMIGLFHPIVVKIEYHFGKKSWWMLFFPGLACCIISLFFSSPVSILIGCLGFSFFWSTIELFFQHERVVKGRAKKNPKRTYYE